MCRTLISLEATLSDAERDRILKLISSKRRVAEIEDALARTISVEAAASQQLRRTICGSCECFSGYRTCDHQVWVGDKWVTTAVTLEACGFFERFSGCLRSLLTLGG